jgi:hypothetical protein
MSINKVTDINIYHNKQAPFLWALVMLLEFIIVRF